MKVLHYILTLLLLLSLAACRDQRSEDLVEQRTFGDSLYVQLALDLPNTSNATRAVPNGGEEGDGWEAGSDNETLLYDFTVFVLSNADINSPSNTTFAGMRYFSHAEVVEADSLYEEALRLKNYDVYKNVKTYDFTIPIVREQSGNIQNADIYRFIVIANKGDLTQTFQTLGELRGEDLSFDNDWSPHSKGIPDKIWTDSDNGPIRFVMTNENDQFYAGSAGTSQTPLRLHVSLERMAARIDFDPEGSTKVNGSLRYPLKSETNQLLDSLYVDNMAIINGCIKPSYYIKRVADFDGTNLTNLTYLGDETPTPSGISTNYVIDPYFLQKTNANRTDNTLLNALFGNNQISNVSSLLAAETSKISSIITSDTPETVTLGYVNENTYARDMAVKEYTTGVILKCRFEPKHNYYTGYDAVNDELSTDSPYTLGSTFYMVEPNNEDISESDRLYFSTETAAKAYATNTAKGHFGKVVKYEGGVCYYCIYMRHSNNVEVIHDTMEFGIVRNNIYRFSINAATGPGSPRLYDPNDDDDTDDTYNPRDPEELKARIYVKKWVSVEHPIIYV